MDDFRNRLADQPSPFLRAHASDPVAWQPWDPIALQAAKAADRPIFVSVGYEACHWSKRMGRECFADPGIAAELNHSFIPIKIDRQELPELDRHFLDVAAVVHHLAGGKGPLGWPLHLVLTPELQPIFAFTFLPAQNSDGQIGLQPLLQKLSSAWQVQEQRREMERVGQDVLRAIAESLTERQRGDEVPSKTDLEQHLEAVLRELDPVHGGREGAPKFALPQLATYLLFSGELLADARPWMALRTFLWKVCHGALFDHFQGGFFRYCTDEAWQRPHFEKMLIDNAMLLKVLAQSMSVISEAWLEQAVQRTVSFLLDELAGQEGLFGAAMGAEYEGIPGGSVLWSADQVYKHIADRRHAQLFCQYYGLEPPSREPGDRALRDQPLAAQIRMPLELFARRCQMDPLDLAMVIASGRSILETARRERASAGIDQTRILGWNAAAVSGLLEASMRCQKPDWRDAAQRTAEAIQTQFWQDGQLVHSIYDKTRSGPATLEDAAHWLHACLDLYSATGKAKWLMEAGRSALWVQTSMQHPEDGLRLCCLDDVRSPPRRPDPFDQAHPSGYGRWAEALLRLHQIEGSAHWREQAQQILSDCGPWLPKVPFGTLGVAIASHRWHAQAQPIWVLHSPSLEDWAHWQQTAWCAGTPLQPVWPVIHGPGGAADEQAIDDVHIDRCGVQGCLERVEGAQNVARVLHEALRAQKT